MIEDNHKNESNFPIPSMANTWAAWSVFLGGLGLFSGCICPLWPASLPSSLYIGLLGIACAVLSKKGKPFTQQAQLGLILSVLAAACGLLMAFYAIFYLDLLGSDAPFYVALREALREYIKQNPQLENIYPIIPVN